jgi:DNA-binding SARP family transcriptional activator
MPVTKASSGRLGAGGKVKASDLAMDNLQIGVLGPIEAHLCGRAISLGGRNEHIVLAALAVAVNRAVSTDILVDAVWKGDPPISWLDTIQSIVSRLRGRLGHEAIESIDHSYRLVVEPDQVDAVRLENLLGKALSALANDPPTAASRAIDALALWRGTPFGNLGAEEFLEPEVRRLEALRRSAIEVRLEADVACGRLTSAIPSLQSEIAEDPYRERLWYVLVVALARDGRRVDALRACHQLRCNLAKIGLEPSADMREVEQMVLQEALAVRSHLPRCGTSATSHGSD